MDDLFRAHRDASLAYVGQLIRRGREVQAALLDDPSSLSSSAAVRLWQQDCATAINELSGGSKAHWLSRAFSTALLVRSTTGNVVVEADVADIVSRLLEVLEQATESLARIDEHASVAAAPAPRRFDFVHNPDLRPIVEQAYLDSGHALSEGHFHEAFVTCCGILEAIITDALEHPRLTPSRSDGAAERWRDARSEDDRRTKASAEPLDAIVDWTFDARIAAAEQAGLIRGGCARLSQSARTYRDLAPDAGISERDAKVVRQVLHVVMRDLDPGR
jgi:hypothetical protein